MTRLRLRDAAALLVVVLLTCAGVWAMLHPTTPEAPLPTDTFGPGAGGAAGSRDGTDFGLRDGRMGHEPDEAEARTQLRERPGMPATGPLLRIERLGLWAEVVEGPGVKRMVLPSNIFWVAASTRAAALDSTRGTTVLSGHVGAGDVPGALHELAQTVRDDEVTTRDADGHTTRWKVSGKQVVDADGISADLFTPTGPRRLVLITCAGRFDVVDGRRQYAQRVVVTAVPA